MLQSIIALSCMKIAYWLVSFTMLRLSYSSYVSSTSHYTLHRACAQTVRKKNKIFKNVNSNETELSLFT